MSCWKVVQSRGQMEKGLFSPWLEWNCGSSAVCEIPEGPHGSSLGFGWRGLWELTNSSGTLVADWLAYPTLFSETWALVLPRGIVCGVSKPFPNHFADTDPPSGQTNDENANSMDWFSLVHSSLSTKFVAHRAFRTTSFEGEKLRVLCVWTGFGANLFLRFPFLWF